MKIKELRELTIDELGGKRRELKHDMLTMRVQQASGQLENPTRIKHSRRDIARMETIISERRLNLVVGKPNGEPKKAKVKAAVKEAAPKAAKKAAKKAPKKTAKKAAAKAAE